MIKNLSLVFFISNSTGKRCVKIPRKTLFELLFIFAQVDNFKGEI